MSKEDIKIKYEQLIHETTDKVVIQDLKQQCKIELLEFAKNENDAKRIQREADKSKARAIKAKQSLELEMRQSELWQSLSINVVWRIDCGVMYAYGLTDADSKEVVLLRDKSNFSSFQNHLIQTGRHDEFKRLYCEWLQVTGGEFEPDWLNNLYEWWRVNPEYEIRGDIKVISNDDSTYTYLYCNMARRLDAIDDIDFPIINEFYLKRINHPDVFCAWMWTPFEPEHTGRQTMVWLSDGNDGKSIYSTALMSNFPRSCAGIGDSDLVNPHAGDFIYDKRMVYNLDCKNRFFLKTELVHKITGNDMIQVNPKFKTPFNSRLNSRLLICCNDAPIIDSFRRNELSRVIMIRSEGMPQFVTELEGRVNKEFPAFLKHCRRKYMELCPDHNTIICPEAMFESIHDECTSNRTQLLREFVDKYVFKDDKSYIQRSDVHTAYRISDLSRESDDSAALIKLIQAQFGVTDSFRIGLTKVRGFKGIAFRGEYAKYNHPMVAVASKVTSARIAV